MVNDSYSCEYYIISLKHTAQKDMYFTFWCPDDNGYTYFIELADIYKKGNLIDKYHINNINCFVIAKEYVKNNMIKVIADNYIGHVLENNTMYRDYLNIDINLLKSSRKEPLTGIKWNLLKELNF